MWTAVMILGLSLAQDFSAPQQAEQGVIAVSAGYNYSPNPFFSASEEIGDPVTTPYFGSPDLGLRLGYYATESIPVLVDVGWFHEKHDLGSGGSIDLQVINFSISGGWQPELNWYARPYVLAGVDQSMVFVQDKIASVNTPATTMTGSMGLHVALGAVAPQLFSSMPWLGAFTELRYTWSPMAQRSRPFWLKGINAMFGLQAQFDASNFSHSSHF